jgi:hypothetical protein
MPVEYTAMQWKSFSCTTLRPLIDVKEFFQVLLAVLQGYITV